MGEWVLEEGERVCLVRPGETGGGGEERGGGGKGRGIYLLLCVQAPYFIIEININDNLISLRP